MAFNTHETVQQLIKNEVLVEKWQEFVAELNLQSTKMVQWRNSFNLRAITPYDLFWEILDEWKSELGRNGTLDTLVEVLNNIGTPYKYEVSGNSITALPLISEASSAPKLNSGLVFFGVTSNVDNFAGRDQEISELQQTINSKFKYALVCGLGGIGKTELVKKFAHYNSNKNHVTWLNGDSPASLISSIHDLAEHLEIQIDSNDSENELTILKKISNHLKNKNWLMIVDNVDEIHDKYKTLIKFTVNIKKVFVVVTSQSRSVLDHNAKLIPIDKLLQADAIKLVTNSLNVQSAAEDIETLCFTLQYFPLALQQAIAYIIQNQRCSALGTKFGIKEYLKDFERQKKKVFDCDLGLTNEYGKTMLITWNLSIQKLQKMSELDFQQVMKILNILAFLNPDQVHVDFIFEINLFPFTTFIIQTLGPSFFGFGTNFEQQIRSFFTDAIETLKTYSIISIENNYISVHRLVQELIRFNLDENSKTKILDTIITNLDLKTLQKTEVQHILSVWKYIQKQPELFIKHRSAIIYIYSRLHGLPLYFESLRFAENNFQLLKEKIREDNQDTLVIESCISTSTMQIGKYEEAFKQLQKLLPKMQRILGKEHATTLWTTTLMAITHNKLKRYSEALKIYYEILEVYMKKFGNDNKDTIATKHNIAVVLSNQRKYADSMQLYQEVLEWHNNKLGPNHPSTLSTRHNIATSLFEQSKYEEALIELENILELRVKYLGEEHASTLNTKSFLADTLAKLGQQESALKMFIEILPLRISTFGEDHPSTLLVRHNRAVGLFKQSKYEEALIEFENILELEMKYFGEKHENILVTKSCLADTLRELGQEERALKLHNEILTLRISTLGEDHPDTIYTKSQIEFLTQKKK